MPKQELRHEGSFASEERHLPPSSLRSPHAGEAGASPTDACRSRNFGTREKYRAIYRVEDARIGQWSAEVAVTVGG
jgi:hypothetical protein